MRDDDLRRFASRPWSEASTLKAEYWAARKRVEGAAVGLEVSRALYEQMRARRPDWPSVQEREEDLLTHIRVAAELRHVTLRNR
ncbi:MAG: hypothetical protein KF901_08530 [Myxococcales bacterium]|nr:hypothetical protein [Myxococcales bacterium]